MKIATWISISDLISIPQTYFEKVVEIFDKKNKFFHTFPLDFIFNSLKHAGVDGLEMLVPMHTSDKDISEVRKILDKYHIPVLSIHQSLSNKKPFSLKEIEKLCKIANIFSSSIVVLHSTTLGKSLINRTFINGLKTLQKKYKIKLGIENMPKTPFTSKLFTYKGKDFSAVVNTAGLYITFDTTHLGQAGEDIIQFYLSNKEKIVHIHISDYKNNLINKHFVSQIDSHLPLKKGGLPIEQFLTILRKESYNGIITMEINSGLTDLCNSAKIIKSVFRN